MTTTFPERLKLARTHRGLSQVELAKRSGINSTQLNHFEGGRREPSFGNLAKLAKALFITADYLLGLRPTMDYLDAE